MVPETTASWSECGNGSFDPFQCVQDSAGEPWVSSCEVKCAGLVPKDSV